MLDKLARLALIPTLAAALAGCATVSDSPKGDPVLRVIGINDFHGNLEPIKRPMGVQLQSDETVTVPVAGAAWLAGTIEQLRAQNEYSLVVSAGDMIGASPLSSSLFLDEPAIGVMNRIGLDFNAVGNHEFDKGQHELERMQNGGCEKFTMRQPCAVEEVFDGSKATFLAANVVTPGGRTLFPAYGIKTYGEGKDAFSVAVIGLTLKDTPTLVTPSGVKNLDFRDEISTINALIPQIRQRGIETIIVAIHQGMYQFLPYGVNSCESLSGPLLDFLAQLDPAVDLVLSGHTHMTYVCDYSQIDPTRHFTVTSAGYGGSFVTDIALTIDRKTHDVRKIEARNQIVQSEGADREGTPLATDPRLGTFAPDTDIAAYVAKYSAAAADAALRPIGKISGEAKRHGPATEETQLGNLIADGQLAATQEAGAQIALMNNSGIRVALVPAADGTLTFGDIYAVQPFGNVLITRSYTGKQVLELLEQQVNGVGFLQTFSVSEGFTFSYDMRRPVGSRIVSASFKGEPIDPNAIYRITMNGFLAAGGDNFTVFAEGTDSVSGPTDLDAFEAYIAAVPVRQLPELGRITEIK